MTPDFAIWVKYTPKLTSSLTVFSNFSGVIQEFEIICYVLWQIKGVFLSKHYLYPLISSAFEDGSATSDTTN